MWRGSCLVLWLLLAGLMALPAVGGRLESELEARWRGAWVILEAETRSDCDGSYTNNRINGRFSVGRGRYRLPPGELMQIVNLNVHRSRVDAILSVHEPLRASHTDGPFTLYEHVSCRVELEIEVPRKMVRDRDADAIEAVIDRVLNRHETLEAATESDDWNGRLAEPFPDDYDQTLAAYAVWRAEQVNARVDARLAEAHQQLDGFAPRVTEDEAYVHGLAAGIVYRRTHTPSRCELLRDVPFAVHRASVPEPYAAESAEKQAWQRGYGDGQALVHYLDVLARVRDCYVPVPTLEASASDEPDTASR
ncbi:MAG: hypothetical protein JSV80_14380 [Acidobacteriota bacterium]|nr:MAG: hypothetical protein JSV80_14380 [Acidobacteriota bacterium]